MSRKRFRSILINNIINYIYLEISIFLITQAWQWLVIKGPDLGGVSHANWGVLALLTISCRVRRKVARSPIPDALAQLVLMAFRSTPSTRKGGNRFRSKLYSTVLAITNL
jgi:hypothetical protein